MYITYIFSQKERYVRQRIDRVNYKKGDLTGYSLFIGSLPAIFW